MGSEFQRDSLLPRVARIVIGVVAVLSIYLVAQLPGLGFDYDHENFFPSQHPETDFYYEFREAFGSDNDFVLIGIERDKGIFKKNFLERVKGVVDTLKGFPHIREVISLVNMKVPVRDPVVGSVFERPLLRWQEPSKYSRDSARLWERPGIVGNLVSEDGQALLISARTTPNLSKKRADSLNDRLQRLKARTDFQEMHLAGRCVAQSYYLNAMREDLATFFVLSLVIVVLFLIIAFRSWWAVLFPILVVLLSTLWLLGLMALLGERINLIQTILPTIMFVVGMSDVVHILSKYLDELRKGREKDRALGIALRQIGLATFLTSLTTAVGFLTLITTGIMPVMDFGIFTAVGVFIAYLLAYSLFPAVILLVPPPRRASRKASAPFWNQLLHKGFLTTLKNKRVILGTFSVLTLLGIYGLSELEAESRLLADLREGDPLLKSFTFLEEHFSGVRPFEMVVMAKDSSKRVYDQDILKETEKLQRFLDTAYQLGAMTSPVTAVKAANRAYHGDDPAFYRLPREPEKLKRIVRGIREYSRQNFDRITGRDGRWARIQGRMKDIGTERIGQRNKALARFYRSKVDTTLVDYQLTGAARLIDLNNERLIESTLKGLMIAFLVIAGVLFLMFRSFRMVLLVLIPNILPLLLMGAVMGYTGINLKLSTSIIFAIAFGIAVDDSIHFASRLRLELSNGRSFLYALKRTYLSTGKAIMITSVILCGGFFTLIFSDFLATFYIGVLILLALLFAVIADLLLLPVLLVIFRKRDRKE